MNEKECSFGAGGGQMGQEADEVSSFTPSFNLIETQSLPPQTS